MVVVFGGVQDGLVKGGGEQAGHRLGGLRRGEVFVQDLFVVDVGQLERELPGLEERAHLDLFVGGGAALFALGQRGKDEAVIKTLAAANENMMAAVRKLKSDLADMPEGERESSQRMAHVVVPDMEAVRRYADEAEKLCSAEYWPFPTYTDLLFSVK